MALYAYMHLQHFVRNKLVNKVFTLKYVLKTKYFPISKKKKNIAVFWKFKYLGFTSVWII